MGKFLARRNIFIFDKKTNLFIVLGVVIAAEIIWAGWTLLKQSTSPQPPIPLQTTQSQVTQVSLTASQTSLKVGEKVTVEINLSSAKLTDGADLVIKYDPQKLSALPVALGNIYSSYPLNSLDETRGRIAVSGITDKSGGSLANGVFGKVIFVARAPGVAVISLDFTPGETSDSNITETGTGKDVLEKVSSLEVNIE